MYLEETEKIIKNNSYKEKKIIVRGAREHNLKEFKLRNTKK